MRDNFLRVFLITLFFPFSYSSAGYFDRNCGLVAIEIALRAELFREQARQNFDQEKVEISLAKPPQLISESDRATEILNEIVSKYTNGLESAVNISTDAVGWTTAKVTDLVSRVSVRAYEYYKKQERELGPIYARVVVAVFILGEISVPAIPGTGLIAAAPLIAIGKTYKRLRQNRKEQSEPQELKLADIDYWQIIQSWEKLPEKGLTAAKIIEKVLEFRTELFKATYVEMRALLLER